MAAKDLTPEQKRARRAKKAQAWDAREAYAKGLLQGIVSMLEPGDVVIDCGANLGAVSGPLADTGAIVHAFEPDPYTFGRLSENLAGRDNVILHNAAVGASAGTLQLMRDADWEKDPDGASVRSTLIAGGRKIDGSNAIDVEVIDFPAFLKTLIKKHKKIAFLKMDIEGAELDVLEAMESQDLFAKIKLTVAETHEKKFKHLRPRFDALRATVGTKYPITKVNLDWI
jgi:FkbM family methyltransferase